MLVSIFFASLIFATTPALAEIDFCDYDSQNGIFFVEDNGQGKKKSVDSGFRRAAVRCSFSYAALYDGDDLYVYSSASGDFERSMMVDDNYPRSEIAVGENGILFYDGDDLYSYCGSSFDRTSMVDDEAPARAFRPARSAAMRVGEDIFVLEQNCEIGKR